MDTVVAALLATVLIPSAMYDLRYRKIPNVITFPAITAGMMYHGVINGRDGLFFSIGGLAVGMGLMLLPYVIGQVGAGDAKLMGAIGALVGPKGTIVAFVISTLAGGIYGATLLLMHRAYVRGFVRRLLATLKTFASTGLLIPTASSEPQERPKLPGAVVIATGTLIYMLLVYCGYDVTV